MLQSQCSPAPRNTTLLLSDTLELASPGEKVSFHLLPFFLPVINASLVSQKGSSTPKAEPSRQTKGKKGTPKKRQLSHSRHLRAPSSQIYFTKRWSTFSTPVGGLTKGNTWTLLICVGKKPGSFVLHFHHESRQRHQVFSEITEDFSQAWFHHLCRKSCIWQNVLTPNCCS